MGEGDSSGSETLEDPMAGADEPIRTLGLGPPGSARAEAARERGGRGSSTMPASAPGEETLDPSDPVRSTLRADPHASAGPSAPHGDQVATRVEWSEVATPPGDTSSDLTIDSRPPTAARDRPVPAIDGYEILGEIGRGGMGVVYRARQALLNRPCVLKMILAGAHAGAESSARFLSEAEVIARLQHPNVVQIHHIGEADGLPYFELEYVEGGSLDRGLAGTPWPARRAAELMEALTRGVAAAHRQGIIHRDLKPGNVLMAADGTPKVTDFGLAKSLAEDSGLTRSDSILGSPGYMAPEQAAGRAKEVGPLADVYALGAILYELLTGRPPFRAATVLETLEQVRTAEPVPPSRLVPGLPRDVETIALKCLQKEPGRRYDSASALAEDLRRFLGGEPIVARPVPPWERAIKWARRRPAIAALAGLAASLVIVTAVVSLSAYARTSAALAEAVGSLYHALVGESRALRTARGVGYRAEVFDRLGRAARLPTPRRDVAELRREAVACLGDFVGLRPSVLGDLGPGPSASALHPRSESVAVGLRDGSVRLYDRATGRPLGRLAGPASPVTALAFGAAGRRLLVGHDDGTIRVADDLAPEALRATEKPKAIGRVGGFSRTDDGRTLVAATTEAPGVVSIRDIEAGGTETVRIDFGENLRGGRWMALPRPNALAISPDGRRVAAGVWGCGSDGRWMHWVVLWDIPSGKELLSVPSPLQSTVYEVAFSPDGSRLAVGHDGGFSILAVADLGTQVSVRLDSAMALRFSPTGQALAVGTISRQVQLWSLTTNRMLADLKHPARSQLWQVVFSDDGRTLASASRESVQLCDLAGASERLEFEGHAGGVTGVAFSPDGATLASSSNVGNVKLWDPATGRHVRTLEGYPGDVQTCAFSPDGSLLATGSKDGALLRLWDTRRWEEAYAERLPDLEFIFFAAFGRGKDAGRGRLAAVGSGLRIWELGPAEPGRAAPRLVASHPAQRCLSVALSTDGERVAFVEDNLKVRIWDLEASRPGPFSGPDLLNGWQALGFRSDRELVYVAGDGTAVVWDVAADRRVRSIGRPGTFESNFIAVSPDGRWLAAEATPSSVSVVDLERGEVAFTFREERSPIWSLAWSRNARRLAVGLSDGGLVVWDLDEVRARLAAIGLAPSSGHPGRE
jgi:eukaryotic-like serine/threonine-protein kinase